MNDIERLQQEEAFWISMNKEQKMKELLEAEERWLSLEFRATQGDWDRLMRFVSSYYNSSHCTAEDNELDDVVIRMTQYAAKSILFDSSYQFCNDFYDLRVYDSLGQNPMISFLIEGDDNFLCFMQNAVVDRFLYFFKRLFVFDETCNEVKVIGCDGRTDQVRLVSWLLQELRFAPVCAFLERMGNPCYGQRDLMRQLELHLDSCDYFKDDLLAIDRLTEKMLNICHFENDHPGVLACLYQP